MADVSSPASWRARRNRGQLFLIGALALAVLFISLAFLLNTAIYTENLATRSDGAAATDVIEYQRSAEAYSRTSLQYVNHHNNVTYPALVANYTGSVNNWSDMAVTHRAANGHISTLTVMGVVRGTRIVQDDNRTFTDKNSATEWTLVENATVRNYVLEVNRDDLTSTDIGNLTNTTPLHITFTEADGDAWTVYVYQDSTEPNTVTIAVEDESGNSAGQCDATTSRVRIGITNRSVNGDDCAALHFFDQLDENYDVSYDRAKQVNGTYSLTVDRQLADIESSHYNTDESGTSPYITPALYSANFRLVYRGPATYYDDEYRIAPGEPDE